MMQKCVQREIMKRSVLWMTLVLMMYAGSLMGQEKITIDNGALQEFNGRVGRWVLINSKNTLLAVIKEHSVTIEEVYALNSLQQKKLLTGDYLFIPYSDELREKILGKGPVRKVIESNPDEFIWPIYIDGVEKISSVLGLRNGRFHTGMDIPAERGVPVIASMEGRVIYSDYLAGYGKTIEIEHRGNFITRYAHNSANLVKKGDYVRKGQIIAHVGSTGNSTGNHLHYEIRCNSVPLDPLDFLPRSRRIQMPHAIKNWK
jgi:murein DD-endopeptidase MepM/ murein hydrolase activator NlpD